MTMITPSYLGETIEYSSLHACRSTLEDPTRKQPRNTHRAPPAGVAFFGNEGFRRRAVTALWAEMEAATRFPSAFGR